jgi:hypothetical protein
MNSRETNVFLTQAALLDPRMKRTDPVDQADMAAAWAEVLADVALSAALVSLTVHYRSRTTSIMPADVLRGAGVEGSSPIPDITAEVVSDDMRRALETAGVTADEVRAHRGDAAWLRAHFPEDDGVDQRPFYAIGAGE